MYPLVTHDPNMLKKKVTRELTGKIKVSLSEGKSKILREKQNFCQKQINCTISTKHFTHLETKNIYTSPFESRFRSLFVVTHHWVTRATTLHSHAPMARERAVTSFSHEPYVNYQFTYHSCVSQRGRGAGEGRQHCSLYNKKHLTQHLTAPSLK